MNRMDFTLIAIFRGPGGFDLLADSLLHLNRYAEIVWDLVVIDHDETRVASRVGEEYLRGRGLPLRHYGIPKLATHPWAAGGYANAVNTGVMYATGRHVVFLEQYAWYHEKMTEHWAGWLSQSPVPAIGCAGAVLYDAPAPSGDPIVTWPDRAGDPRGWWTPKRPAVPSSFDLGCWAAPVEFFEKTNGLDERADFDDGWCTGNAIALAKAHGYAALVERRCVYHRIDPRAWNCCRRPKVGQPSRPQWTGWSANPYVLRDVRAMLEAKRHAESLPAPVENNPEVTIVSLD